MSKATTVKFIATGSWVCPPGVSVVNLVGCGGGGGGGGGGTGDTGITPRVSGGGGGAGGSARVISRYVNVIPNMQYNTTIGTSGSGGGSSTVGAIGGDTTFIDINGAVIAIFYGAGRGYAGWDGASVGVGLGGDPGAESRTSTTTSGTISGAGGNGGTTAGGSGRQGSGFFVSSPLTTATLFGAGGTNLGNFGGGGGGGAPAGNKYFIGSVAGSGSNGNNLAASLTPADASLPPANSGIGGGGGGGSGAQRSGGTGLGAAGANGAMGFLWITYKE